MPVNLAWSVEEGLRQHLTKLEEASYVKIEKRFAGKKPLTLAHLTKQGRGAWIAYLDRLQSPLNAAE